MLKAHSSITMASLLTNGGTLVSGTHGSVVSSKIFLIVLYLIPRYYDRLSDLAVKISRRM